MWNLDGTGIKRNPDLEFVCGNLFRKGSCQLPVNLKDFQKDERFWGLSGLRGSKSCSEKAVDSPQSAIAG
jgi:hypothetical protein